MWRLNGNVSPDTQLPVLLCIIFPSNSHEWNVRYRRRWPDTIFLRQKHLLSPAAPVTATSVRKYEEALIHRPREDETTRNLANSAVLTPRQPEMHTPKPNGKMAFALPNGPDHKTQPAHTKSPPERTRTLKTSLWHYFQSICRCDRLCPEKIEWLAWRKCLAVIPPHWIGVVVSCRRRSSVPACVHATDEAPVPPWRLSIVIKTPFLCRSVNQKA